MSRYFLCRDIYLCEVDEAAIALDLRKQKYFGLPSQCWNELKLIFPELAASGGSAPRAISAPVGETFQHIDFLLEQGILTRSEAEGRKPSIALVRTESSFLSVKRSATLKPMAPHHLARFLTSVAYVALNLRRSRAPAILHRWRLRGETNKSEPCDLPKARDLVMRFLRLRTWTYTRRDACLLDSYALTDFLRRYGFKPTLVVGVSTKPFQAHAWVQLGPVVLNDIIENVHQYTPILAV